MSFFPKWLARWRKPKLLVEAPPELPFQPLPTDIVVTPEPVLAPPVTPEATVSVAHEAAPVLTAEPAVEPPAEVAPALTPEVAAATLQPSPSAAPDTRELLAYAKTRVAYFSPAGYAPYQAKTPRLIAPARRTDYDPEAEANPNVREYLRRPAAAGSGSRLEPGAIGAVHPASFAAYLLSAEQDARFDPDFAGPYLRESELLTRALRLRTVCLESWQAGKEALTAADLYREARAQVSDVPTALLLCHNVTKSFARGGLSIPWRKTDRLKGKYSDGVRTYLAKTGSIFYLLFSPSVFGTNDPGDWSRWFGWAALAAWVAADRTTEAVHSASSFLKAWTALLEPAAKGAPLQRAWNIAVAASSAELSAYGRSAESNVAVAKAQLTGVLFGLSEVQKAPPQAAVWPVPVPTGTMRLDAPLASTLDSAGKVVPATSVVAPSPEPFAVERALLESVWVAARRSQQQTTPALHLTLTVEEGLACRLATGLWDDGAVASCAQPLLDAIGPNVLVHAAARQVRLNLTPSSCEMDRGNGFERIKVLPGASQ
jgi:hypothetical protein